MTRDETSELFLTLLKGIRDSGVQDPNVNLFIGVLEDDLAAVKKALEQGANVNATDSEVLNYHRGILAARMPDEFRRFRETKADKIIP